MLGFLAFSSMIINQDSLLCLDVKLDEKEKLQHIGVVVQIEEYLARK